MKQQCDNNCETCPMQSQIYCALMFVKANNASMGALAERLDSIEATLRQEEPVANLINPLANTMGMQETEIP